MLHGPAGGRSGISESGRLTNHSIRRKELTPLTAPLPEGWKYFRSQAKPVAGAQLPMWYATAPYHIPRLPDVEGRRKLDQTVSAPTWRELHRLVDEQVQRYRALTL
ncbi:hypothetical protein GCM10010390_11620 [Streptomyces mordarskii]|uniref:Uncharacterized protein n=1 Tax=Streptomyces mordarskii TaxID=1226758 RepID=A0ABP3LZY9_9ACTN